MCLGGPAAVEWQETDQVSATPCLQQNGGTRDGCQWPVMDASALQDLEIKRIFVFSAEPSLTGRFGFTTYNVKHPWFSNLFFLCV